MSDDVDDLCPFCDKPRPHCFDGRPEQLEGCERLVVTVESATPAPEWLLAVWLAGGEDAAKDREASACDAQPVDPAGDAVTS